MDPTVSTSRRAMARGGTIAVVAGPASSAELVVGLQKAVIGRDAGCALVLSDKKVSRAQLEVVGTEHGLLVRDAGSRNGTYHGEVRIVEALFTKPATLRCGDTLLECRPGDLERVPMAKGDHFGELWGATPAMRAVFEQARGVARSDLSVLIEGETGTGKELLARAIHTASARAKGPFVVIDCTSIPTELAESELFGHERGAFTGAGMRRISPFVEAGGGTVFIDELGELPKGLQAKLLRVLAEKRVKSVGSNTYAKVDVRVLAATRRDLLADCNDDQFRSDLFFRVAQARIDMPALRDRVDDIPLLIDRMLGQQGRADARNRLVAESFDRVLRYDWPGNVRELWNMVARIAARDDGSPIDLVKFLDERPGEAARAVKGKKAPGKWRERPYDESRDEHDRAYFGGLYEVTRGNQSEMTRRSGLARETVRKRMKELGIAAG
jgi:DNA-binding NtrC family response regulator